MHRETTNKILGVDSLSFQPSVFSITSCFPWVFLRFPEKKASWKECGRYPRKFGCPRLSDFDMPNSCRSPSFLDQVPRPGMSCRFAQICPVLHRFACNFFLGVSFFRGPLGFPFGFPVKPTKKGFPKERQTLLESLPFNIKHQYKRRSHLGVWRDGLA